MNIVVIAHYFPPINSAGAKRFEALTKYFINMGHNVTVITPRKSLLDGDFTEEVPNGVNLIELNKLGKESASSPQDSKFEVKYTKKPSYMLHIKKWVMRWLGQIPDPRLPFAFSFLYPWLSKRVKCSLNEAHIIIGTSPPWSMLLAAIIAKYRFKVPCILDYRDHFSECHEMPGSKFSKTLERIIDKFLVIQADHIVAISEPMATYYSAIRSNVTTIYNGFDPELFNIARKQISSKLTESYVTIRYMGSVSPGRIPYRFLDALIKLRISNYSKFQKLRIEFYGNAHIIKDILKLNYSELKDIFYFYNSVPYLISLQYIIEADYLLFCETSSKSTLSAQGILTTKLFEYIGSGRPIIADISPETLAGSVIKNCNDLNLVSQSSEDFYFKLCLDDFYIRTKEKHSAFSERFSRKAQAFQYTQLINNILEVREASGQKINN